MKLKTFVKIFAGNQEKSPCIDLMAYESKFITRFELETIEKKLL